jgi:hypothetical protein
MTKRLVQVAAIAAALTFAGAGAAQAGEAVAGPAATPAGFELQVSSRTLVGYGAWTDPEGALGIAEADAFNQAAMYGFALCEVVDRQVYPLGTGGGAWQAYVTLSCAA